MLAAEDTAHPTPFPEVNGVVSWLRSEIQAILGAYFIGMYLDGSLASGDFDPQSSDIDFLVTTTATLPDALVGALAEMHKRFEAGGSSWAHRIEGSYIPQYEMRAYDPTSSPPGRFPRIEMGSPLRVVQHDIDWLFHRSILWERGIVVVGPEPRTWLDPVDPDTLRRAMAGTLHEWWELMLDDPGPLRDPSYRAYGFLTMCRALYTIEHGRIASKPQALSWAAANVGAEWGEIGARAMSVRALGVTPDVQPVTIEEVQAAIRYVVGRSQAHG